MKLLGEIFQHDVHPNLDWDPDVLLVDSPSARAVLLDEQGRVPLMYKSVRGYYSLPGGKLDEGEDYETALHREIMEEVGCDIDVGGLLGEIMEYRVKRGYKKISRCYYGNVRGELCQPVYTKQEKAVGAEIRWVHKHDVIGLMKNSDMDSYSAPFVIKRDVIFLKEAVKIGFLDI